MGSFSIFPPPYCLSVVLKRLIFFSPELANWITQLNLFPLRFARVLYSEDVRSLFHLFRLYANIFSHPGVVFRTKENLYLRVFDTDKENPDRLLCKMKARYTQNWEGRGEKKNKHTDPSMNYYEIREYSYRITNTIYHFVPRAEVAVVLETQNWMTGLCGIGITNDIDYHS